MYTYVNLSVYLNVSRQITDYTSFIWTDRYDRPGDFELIVPYTSDNATLYRLYDQITCNLSRHYMIIEDITISVSNDEKVMHIKGRSGESILDRRVVPQTLVIDQYSYTSNKLFNGLSEIFRSATGSTAKVMTPANNYSPNTNANIGNRSLGLDFSVGADPLDHIKDSSAEIEATGKDLLTIFQDECQPRGFGFAVYKDSNSLVIYDGTVRPDVVFSEDNSLVSAEYSKSIASSKNAVFVQGEEYARHQNTITVGGKEYNKEDLENNQFVSNSVYVNNGTSNVPVRNKPSTSGTVVEYIESGQEVVIRLVSGGWGAIKDTENRWVKMSQLEKRDKTYYAVVSDYDPDLNNTEAEYYRALVRIKGTNEPLKETYISPGVDKGKNLDSKYWARLVMAGTSELFDNSPIQTGSCEVMANLSEYAGYGTTFNLGNIVTVSFHTIRTPSGSARRTSLTMQVKEFTISHDQSGIQLYPTLEIYDDSKWDNYEYSISGKGNPKNPNDQINEDYVDQDYHDVKVYWMFNGGKLTQDEAYDIVYGRDYHPVWPDQNPSTLEDVTNIIGAYSSQQQGDWVQPPSFEPTYPRHTFLGWFKNGKQFVEHDETKTDIEDIEVADYISDGSGDIVYYAKWALNKYIITWERGDYGIFGAPYSSEESVQQEYEYGSTPRPLSVLPKSTGSQHSRHVFMGWDPQIVPLIDDYVKNTSPVWVDDKFYKKVSGEYIKVITLPEGEDFSQTYTNYYILVEPKNATYTAQWGIKYDEFKVTYNAGSKGMFQYDNKRSREYSKMYEYGDMPDDPDVDILPTDVDYEFDGWDKDFTEVRGNQTYIAQWVLRDHDDFDDFPDDYDGTVAWDSGPYALWDTDGDGVGDTEVVYTHVNEGEDPVPPDYDLILNDEYADDYEFVDWDMDIDPETGSVTYTAEFEEIADDLDDFPDEYNGNVAWDSGPYALWDTDGDGVGDTEVVYTWVPEGGDPVPPGYDLIIDDDNGDGEPDYDFSGWVMDIDPETGEITYEAEWEEIEGDEEEPDDYEGDPGPQDPEEPDPVTPTRGIRTRDDLTKKKNKTVKTSFTMQHFRSYGSHVGDTSTLVAKDASNAYIPFSKSDSYYFVNKGFDSEGAHGSYTYSADLGQYPVVDKNKQENQGAEFDYTWDISGEMGTFTAQAHWLNPKNAPFPDNVDRSAWLNSLGHTVSVLGICIRNSQGNVVGLWSWNLGGDNQHITEVSFSTDPIYVPWRAWRNLPAKAEGEDPIAFKRGVYARKSGSTYFRMWSKPRDWDTNQQAYYVNKRIGWKVGFCARAYDINGAAISPVWIGTGDNGIINVKNPYKKKGNTVIEDDKVTQKFRVKQPLRGGQYYTYDPPPNYYGTYTAHEGPTSIYPPFNRPHGDISTGPYTYTEVYSNCGIQYIRIPDERWNNTEVDTSTRGYGTWDSDSIKPLNPLNISGWGWSYASSWSQRGGAGTIFGDGFNDTLWAQNTVLVEWGTTAYDYGTDGTARSLRVGYKPEYGQYSWTSYGTVWDIKGPVGSSNDFCFKNSGANDMWSGATDSSLLSNIAGEIGDIFKLDANNFLSVKDLLGILTGKTTFSWYKRPAGSSGAWEPCGSTAVIFDHFGSTNYTYKVVITTNKGASEEGTREHTLNTAHI